MTLGPDFRPLVRVAQTKQGRSEVSCVIQYDHPDFIRARPMILTDDTRSSHFTFADQVCVQTDHSSDVTGAPDELRQTIASYLWLTNLEISAGITPKMSLHATLPRSPHIDGPTRMTLSQLSDAQLKRPSTRAARHLQDIEGSCHQPAWSC